MQIKDRQKLLTIVAIVAVALLAIDKIVLPPLEGLWKSRSARIADLRARVNEGTQLLRREQYVRARWSEMETNTLPNNASLAEQQLLSGFDRWSRESGVSVNSVMPQWKQDADDFKTLECRVDVSGNLNTLSRFLYNLERDPMAVKMQSVELSSRDNEGQQLTLGLQVSALVLTPKK